MICCRSTSVVMARLHVGQALQLSRPISFSAPPSRRGPCERSARACGRGQSVERARGMEVGGQRHEGDKAEA
eukprot:352873-Chlamydomonas_euryale.AAC.2